MIRESWLTEVAPDAPCGPDLEYDQDFMALERAAQGKEEQQYGDKVFAAEEPVWTNVVDLATALMERTRDVRVVLLLGRGLTRTQGMSGAAEALRLAHDLLERFWDDVHPRLVIDGEVDPMPRMNAIAAFCDREKFLRDLRAADFLRTPQVAFTLRDVENILDQNLGKADGGLGPDQMRAAIGDAIAADPAALPEAAALADAVEALRETLQKHLEPSMLPDFEPLASLVKPIARIVEEIRAAATGAAAGGTAEGAEAAVGGGGAGAMMTVGDVRSREDALRALDRVCDFLSRNEPTNPAPLFIRRAQRLMTMPFMDIIRELAPEAEQQVETITGARREA
ncbi:MAG: type VI secretion system protein TssA [Burkholderiales bacterium]